MADVGTVTGIVGMLTGIAGSVWGFLAYRQSGKNNVLDLRLQLRREKNALAALLDRLPSTIDLAKQSRGHVLAATGLARSGNQLLFDREWEVDRAAIAALVTTASKIDGNDFSLSGDDLELLLGEVHRLTLTASSYSDKYRAALAADDTRRSEIRAEHVALAAARMQIPLKKKLGE